MALLSRRGGMKMGRQITRLPTSVVSHLRSSTILSNVAQIAEELVCNSLDAGATQIEVAVDGEACHLKVDDDGCGISRDDLTLVGERHATSKLHCLDELEEGVATLGFRGEALSSLCDLALVEVTSRCRGMPNTYRKILKGSTTISIGLCGEQRPQGTTVIARDMFYNQPVRRRLLKSSYRKTLQSVKECVVRLVLIHPRVSFTVKDLARKEVLLHTKRAATLKSTLCDIFGEDTFSRLQEIDYAQGHLRLSGYLSKTYYCHPSKALQYFYINRRYVLKTALHKLLNSWVGPNIYSHSGKCKDPLGQATYEGEKGEKVELISGKHLCPAFVLNMTCPSSDYDVTFEASKTLVEFKDWMPVASFVRSVLQEIWGDQSTGKKQGIFQALERHSDVSLKKTSNNGKTHQPITARHPAHRKEAFPSMPVRRSLVQSDFDHPDYSNKDRASQDKVAASAREILQKPGSTSRSTVSSGCLFGKEITGIAPCFEIISKETQLIKPAKNLQSNFNSDSDVTALATNWLVTPCRQQRTSDQVVVPSRLQMGEPCPPILGSDWFSKGVFSPESEEQHSSRFDTAAFTPLVCTDGMSAFSPEKDQCRSSSIGRRRRLVHSRLSQTDIFGSPLDNSTKKSRNHKLGGRFTGEARYLASPEDIDVKCGKQWWETDDFKHKTHLWSGSDDSIGSPRILDTSDFFPEVSSSSPEGTLRGLNLFHESKWAQFDTGHTEGEMTWMSQVQAKRQRVKFIDDFNGDGINTCFSANLPSFHPNPDKCLGSVELNRSKVDTQKGSEDMARYCTDAFLQATIDDANCSTNSDDWLDAAKHHDYDIGLISYKPRSKRRLYVNFDNSSDDLQLPADNTDKEKPSKGDMVSCASAPQVLHLGRGHSGPPFYRPPRRHGVHANPLNSLSTVTKILTSVEDGGIPQIEADPSEILSKAPQDSNQTRHKPENEIECKEIISIQAGEPGIDGVSQSILPPKDLEQLGKHTTTGIAEETELLLDGVKSTQPALEVILHQNCKYRSTDENNTGIEGAELPMDTVRGLFKEWSNPCMKKDDDILDISSGILASSNSSLLPGSITKDVLKQARVLQQVDTKFIASVSCGVLLLIDQHAADERVRLEELREDVLGGHITKQISLLSDTQELTVTFTEQQILQTCRKQIEDWGWRFKIPTGPRPERRNKGMCKVLLSAMHSLMRQLTMLECNILKIQVPSILGVSLTAEDLTEYLRQLTDTQGSSAPPPAVIRLLNYKACRGAIMFGDTLLPVECNQLVEHLKKTSLCFQCAHGRPTMVPLVDLHALHKRFDRTRGSSRKSSNTDFDTGSGLKVPNANSYRGRWHGLEVDVKPNLERAQERLRQAQGLS